MRTSTIFERSHIPLSQMDLRDVPDGHRAKVRLLFADGKRDRDHAEAITGRNQRFLADYINMGDSYDSTILRTIDGRYIVSSWGDYVETYERRHGSIDEEIG